MVTTATVAAPEDPVGEAEKALLEALRALRAARHPHMPWQGAAVARELQARIHGLDAAQVTLRAACDGLRRATVAGTSGGEHHGDGDPRRAEVAALLETARRAEADALTPPPRNPIARLRAALGRHGVELTGPQGFVWAYGSHLFGSGPNASTFIAGNIHSDGRRPVDMRGHESVLLDHVDEVAMSGWVWAPLYANGGLSVFPPALTFLRLPIGPHIGVAGVELALQLWCAGEPLVGGVATIHLDNLRIRLGHPRGTPPDFRVPVGVDGGDVSVTGGATAGMYMRAGFRALAIAQVFGVGLWGGVAPFVMPQAIGEDGGLWRLGRRARDTPAVAPEHGIGATFHIGAEAQWGFGNLMTGAMGVFPIGNPSVRWIFRAKPSPLVVWRTAVDELDRALHPSGYDYRAARTAGVVPELTDAMRRARADALNADRGGIGWDRRVDALLTRTALLERELTCRGAEPPPPLGRSASSLRRDAWGATPRPVGNGRLPSSPPLGAPA